MRTTISIPDEVYSEARKVMGSRPFSEFASEAIRTRIQQLKREHLAHEMAEGYRAEAEHLSLGLEWSEIETEGL
jgi:predicted CopG family antitoxin